MSRVSSRLSFVGHRSLVVIQTFLLIATLFAPIPVGIEHGPGDDEDRPRRRPPPSSHAPRGQGVAEG